MIKQNTSLSKEPRNGDYSSKQNKKVGCRSLELMDKIAEEKSKAAENWKAREEKRKAEEKVAATCYIRGIEETQMRVREQQQKQLEFINCSEAIFKRVDRKLAKLEVDKFFYQEQQQLYCFRRNFLDATRYYGSSYYRKESEFLVTQMFDEYLEVMEQFEVAYDPPENTPPGHVVYLVPTRSRTSPYAVMDPDLCKESAAKFYVPALTVHYLDQLHRDNEDGACMCYNCQLILFNKVKPRLRWIPEAAELAEFLIHVIYCVSPPSLKELCLKRVLELELEQESLPETLRETMRRGPEPRELSAKGEVMVRRLKKMVKQLREERLLQ